MSADIEDSTTNITITVPDVPPHNQSQTASESADATAPNTNPINPDAYIPPALGTSANAIEPHPGALVLQTFSDVQLSNTNSALFGALTAFGLVVLYQAWSAYRRRRKPIYLLNGLQSLFLFIKTLCATLYAVMISGTLNCSARSPLMNIPMVIAWDLIYGIMLIKLLLFTEWKRTAMVIIPLGAAAHFAVVVAGIIMRESGVTSLGLCTDRYPVVFKHQYDIELFLEVFTTAVLLQGIASKKQGVFAGTKEIFRQLQANEHTRVFFAIIFVTLKIVLAYGKFGLPTAATHAIDSARSAVVSWALTREVGVQKSGTGPAPGGGDRHVKKKHIVFKGASSQRNPHKTNIRVNSPQDLPPDDQDDNSGCEDIPGFNYDGERQRGEGNNDGDASRETVAQESGDLV
ncbi:hypothetical protein DFJ77DRAFT_472399 [Powellomyces hirtus]|nr:hypothetical protein DFJ77DRAFT_472399 [Powellomyces hirtus]